MPSVDQPVGGGVEVVEHLLLVLAHAGAVPGLALLVAAAEAGDGVAAAVLARTTAMTGLYAGDMAIEKPP